MKTTDTGSLRLPRRQCRKRTQPTILPRTTKSHQCHTYYLTLHHDQVRPVTPPPLKGLGAIIALVHFFPLVVVGNTSVGISLVAEIGSNSPFFKSYRTQTKLDKVFRTDHTIMSNDETLVLSMAKARTSPIYEYRIAISRRSDRRG